MRWGVWCEWTEDGVERGAWMKRLPSRDPETFDSQADARDFIREVGVDESPSTLSPREFDGGQS